MTTYKLTDNQLEQIQREIHAIGGKVQEAIKKLTKIESYLYDDNDTDSPGMVARQREHEKRITKLENESMERKKIWAALGFSAGVVGTALVEFIKYFFTNHKP